MSGFFNLLKYAPKAKKYVYETVVPKIAKNLKKRREAKDDIIKTVDTQSKGTLLSNQTKSKIKKDAAEEISKIHDKYQKKATGGRVGRKFGTPLKKRKSNIQKIKEAFGPKKKVPSKFKGFSKLPENVQQKIDAKLAKKV
tara:strand:- start:882 stop:1301 length:420 start_codon:yes stop_codon:yes gene_type:complete